MTASQKHLDHDALVTRWKEKIGEIEARYDWRLQVLASLHHIELLLKDLIDLWRDGPTDQTAGGHRDEGLMP